jgi:hypothetical protein
MEINGKAYQYIALGTGFRKSSPDESKTGRLIILSLNTNATTGLIDVSRRFQVFCDDPVYSLAQYESRYIPCPPAPINAVLNVTQFSGILHWQAPLPQAT